MKKTCTVDIGFEKYYMYEFRQQIIRQGFLTLIDFIFVPAILIIFLTYYRFQNISKEMKHNFGWKTKRLVLENVILIICDIIFLPLFIIVLISCYRYSLFTDLVNKQGEQKFNCKHSVQRYIFAVRSIIDNLRYYYATSPDVISVNTVA